MMKTDPIGLYVHIPFCKNKCNYCDFCSFSNVDMQERTQYIDALISEIYSYSRQKKIKIDTIFFGGGTPSLLTVKEFSDVCDAISKSFEISENAEFTVELNPKTVDAEKLSSFVLHGVNRISIGMQTIHENECKILGRIHDFQDFKDAYQLVRNAGISNINIDIMYGIPDQTKESFSKTLESVLSFAPSHISVYGLILEDGTPLYDMRESLAFPSEDEECEMYEVASRILSSHGYYHYEISNYAIPGLESRHNLKYWRNREYIGVGLSAYSFFENKRYGNTSFMKEYLSSPERNYSCSEHIDLNSSAFEYVMLGLRLEEGISLSEYKELYGVDFMTGREEKIRLYIDAGYMKSHNGRISLTERGFYVSNSILTELI